MDFVLELHSLVRWLVVIVAVVAIIRFALVTFGVMPAGKLERILMSAFTGLVDTQVLIGIILIIIKIANSGYANYQAEHAVTMIIAAVVGHISIRWRKAEPKVQARNNLITVLVVLVLVFIGVARLPGGGWAR